MAAMRRSVGDGGRRLPATLAAALVLAAGCSSPEAGRTLGGGPGADPRNTGAAVEMHAGSRPYHDTPCLGGPAVCAEEEASTTVARSGAQ